MLVSQRFATVHGHRRAYLTGGSGPALLLVHGIGDSSGTWSAVAPRLADRCTVVAPDLLGHGASDKPRADYSIGGFANGMRDLLVLLDIERVTVVGHSLGGGVALQFAYQYPQMVERLVLVASGGLGAEVMPLLRLAALPGAHAVIGMSTRAPLRLSLTATARAAARLGLLDATDVGEMTRIWSGLRDPSTRAAFLRTLRTVIDVKGQFVSSQDRLYLAETLPMLLVWGDRDPVLPVRHAQAVARHLPGCEIDVVHRAGHMPHLSHPERFVDAVTRFLDATPPAQFDAERWRQLLSRGAGA